MGTKPYVIFTLHHNRYAIAATAIAEIFLLPELAMIAETPSDIVGVMNLHSEYVPVMHLDLRFGHKFNQCNLNDNVIVVESQQLKIGVIVHQVETVIDIDERYIQQDLAYGREQNINQAFLQGIISLDDEMIILLDVDNLVRHSEALTALDQASEAEDVDSDPIATNFYQQYFVDANNNTKEILRQRAVNLKKSEADGDEVKESTAIAIVSIGDRYFGIDLDIVREFSNVSKMTSIPCCPGHIVGNMNLRGEILTLVDIAQPLNLDVPRTQESHKAVVVEADEIKVGIMVQEVHDVIDVDPGEIKSVPIAVDSGTSTYFRGVLQYQEQNLNLLDVQKLLTQGAMTVELNA